MRGIGLLTCQHPGTKAHRPLFQRMAQSIASSWYAPLHSCYCQRPAIVVTSLPC